MTLNYNIHDIINIQVERKNKIGIFSNFDLELSAFQVNDTNEYDIQFNVGKFYPSNSNCYIVDHKYYVKNNYFYCKDNYNGIDWKIEITGFERGPTSVNFDYNSSLFHKFKSSLSLETFLLRPIIYFKLMEKKYFMIHGAGVTKANDAWIFPSRGGAFKTSLIINLINYHNYLYLSDDWTILHNDRVLGFPAHSNLVNYMIKNKTDENLNIWQKINFLKGIMMKENLNGYDKKSYSIKKILFLVKLNGNSMKFTELEHEESVNKIINSNFNELSSNPNTFAGFSLGPYYNYLLAYLYIYPNNYLQECFNVFKNNLVSIFKRSRVLEISIPIHNKNFTFTKIAQIMEDIK